MIKMKLLKIEVADTIVQTHTHTKKTKMSAGPETKKSKTSQQREALPLSAHLERLSSVSRVFMDQRVLEQRKEIESLREENRRLQLQLFWRDHEVSALESLMLDLNTARIGSPRCDCSGCCVAGRFPMAPRKPFVEETCQFKAFFEQKLQDLGMTFICLHGMKRTIIRMEACDPFNGVCDKDCHLVNLSGKNWFNFYYGRKLWSAFDVHDPELQKLATLFKWMRESVC